MTAGHAQELADWVADVLGPLRNLVDSLARMDDDPIHITFEACRRWPETGDSVFAGLDADDVLRFVPAAFELWEDCRSWCGDHGGGVREYLDDLAGRAGVADPALLVEWAELTNEREQELR